MHVKTFSTYILYVCVFIYTQYTHIYYVHKNIILDAINRCQALLKTHKDAEIWS